MLTLEQLNNVVFKRPVYIDFIYDEDWCHLKTSLKDGVATVYVYFKNDWVQMYHLAKDQASPLIDSTVYESEDYIVDRYYQQMTDNFVRYLIGLTIPPGVRIYTKVWSYCHYCKRRIVSYSSLVNGYGSECLTRKPKNTFGKYIYDKRI